MKKYTQPSIELVRFSVEDIMSDSAGSISAGKNASTEVKAAATEALKGAGYTVVEW